MEEHRHFPDINQLSVVTSTILLAYALMPFVRFQAQFIQLNLPLGTFSFSLDFNSLVTILVALLAGLAMDILLNNHPHFAGGFPLQHVLLPALTAWILGVTLNSTRMGITWWVLFGIGALLLVLVFTGEYIAMDFSDERFAFASIGLTALSFALLLTLTIALRNSNLRLYLILPSVIIPVVLVSLRTLYLRLGGRWSLIWGAVIGVVIAQVAVGLQYLPVSPVAYGLVLAGCTYALTSLAASVEDGRPLRSSWLEPVITLALSCGLVLVIGG